MYRSSRKPTEKPLRLVTILLLSISPGLGREGLRFPEVGVYGSLVNVE